MKKIDRKGHVEELDRKIKMLKQIESVVVPEEGWVHSIRLGLKMSLRQLGKRMNITFQSVRDIELRENEGTISLNALKEVAKGLNMKLVYGFIPNEDSISAMIEKRAHQLATDIIIQSSQKMKLDKLGNRDERIERAVKEITAEIVKTMPPFLWD